MPYILTDDTNFSCVRNAFKQHFENWVVPIKQQVGNFSKTKKNKKTYQN